MSGSKIHRTNNSRSPGLASAISRTQRENLELTQKSVILEAHRSSVLEEQALKDMEQLSSFKEECRPRQAELDALKSEISSVQDQCRKFEKTKVEVSMRITDLTTRIIQDKAAELDKINNVRKHLSDLQQALAETISSPECRDRLVASLTAQQKQLEVNTINLDREVQRAEEALLTEAQEECLTTDEANVALEVFEENRDSLERTVAALTKRKQQLEDELERLSREG